MSKQFHFKQFSPAQVRSLFGFYGLSTFVGYLMAHTFLYKKQFYFKQFSLE